MEGVGLLYPDYDSRLDDPKIDVAVGRILEGLSQVLGESKALQTRYGLKAVTAESGLSGSTQAELPLMTMGKKREDRFSSALKAFYSRGQPQESTVSSAKKIRWAIVDKTKFTDLVNEVMYFTSRLRDIVPLKQEETMRMTSEDIRNVSEIQHLQLAFDAASGYEEGIAEAAKLAIPQRPILRRLWFRVMDERRHAVKLHHYRTLKWTLQGDNRTLEWDNLPEWLESGSGIYWLSGKAGSGKSTLMKILLSEHETREYLFTWAGDSLVMESFFFWHLGHEQQKSIEGLRQALLYKILEADPQLTQSLLPSMWQETCIPNDVPRDLPSAGEIDNAFQVLVQGNAM
ncbi:hypothetical protein KJ359_005544 [Pestalotiopsis sp. 9143b]|nr:hypothetical protein KJ359_005544 [Pestalotiopsis sp. 9143b]